MKASYKNWIAPDVRYDRPLTPEPYPKRKAAALARVHEPPPWNAFLASLPTGASFDCDYWELACIKTAAKKVGAEVAWRRNSGARPACKYWRVWITTGGLPVEYLNKGLDI